MPGSPGPVAGELHYLASNESVEKSQFFKKCFFCWLKNNKLFSVTESLSGPTSPHSLACKEIGGQSDEPGISEAVAQAFEERIETPPGMQDKDSCTRGRLGNRDVVGRNSHDG